MPQDYLSVTLNGQSHPVAIKRHAKAKKLKLRLSRAGGEISLTMPPKLPISQGKAFIEQNLNWLALEMEQALPIIPVGHGIDIPIQGTLTPIKYHSDDSRRIQMRDQTVWVPADDTGLTGARLKRWLMKNARHHIEESLAYHQNVMNITIRDVGIGDMKTRWGSCAYNGSLRFNFRLIMAPKEVMDYVVIHELAHRRHMDHSRQFWQLVGDYCPDYKEQRLRLKTLAADLQRYHF